MVRLEDRVLMDAQRAEDARSARLAQVLGRDPGKWLQLAGGFGIALDLLTPPVGMFGLIAAGTGIVGYNASMRRAEELRRLNADGHNHVWFSEPYDVLYSADKPYLPGSMRIDEKRCDYLENVFIERTGSSGVVETIHARIGDDEEQFYLGRATPLLRPWTRADVITRGFIWREIIRAYPLD